MPGTWSISTTLRNPERIKGFLKVLARFEGEVFDEETQSRFFKELIKTKQYKPNGLSEYYNNRYEEPGEFTEDELFDIIDQLKYKNKSFNDDKNKVLAMRGRTAVSNITKMGLAIAKESMGKVKITELGKKLLAGEIDLSTVFLRYFLKWQYPNPSERGFSHFNINPFIASLHVIHRVNEKWHQLGHKPVGLSKEEFSLFIITLIDYQDIDKVVEEIITFRKEKRQLDINEQQQYVEDQFIKKAIEVFNLNPLDINKIRTKVNNLYDYGDSAIRYFRQTKLLYYRGKGRYIDLAPTRIIEIQRLLKQFNGSAIPFDTEEKYLSYMSDINQPELPWENINDLKLVYENLLEQANALQQQIVNQFAGQELHSFKLTKQIFKNIESYRSEIARIREIIKTLNNDLTILKEKSLTNLDYYIEKLLELDSRRRKLSGQDPLYLEYYVAQTLMAIDDAKEISPNYSVGDDNMPIFTAPGNSPDIECYYFTFNMICEVTLLRGRDQWYYEGQPVMRHFRDFEDKVQNQTVDNFCLFIAPSIHRDTLNTFWMSIKLGYEGRVQKIIPLTICQYVTILKRIKELNEQGKRINHQEFKKLLSSIFQSHEEAGNNSIVWLNNIDTIIENWYQSLIPTNP